jgi:hypothetical protein
MSMPIILFANLFTLKDRDVTKNKYIDMYYIWLNNVIKYGNLRSEDYCITFVDEITLRFMRSSQIFKFLVSKISNCHFIEYNQPSNIKDGIMKRYDIEEIQEITKTIEYLNPIYLHLDIDVLIVKDIHILFKDYKAENKTTIFLKPEFYWDFFNGLYYGELATEEDKELIRVKNVNMPGFGAGIFGWSNSKDIAKYFNYIKNIAKTVSKELHTVEQPFFNAAIFNYFFKEVGIFNFILFSSDLVVENPNIFEKISEKIVLINYCGGPGDERNHWDKQFLQLLFQSLLT